MSLDLSNMCRTCLECDKQYMVPLFGKKPGKTSTVFEMFKSITSLEAKITDGLPGKVCITCFTEINRAYSFKIKCEASEQTLKQLIDKGEDNEEENDQDQVEEKYDSKNSIVLEKENNETNEDIDDGILDDHIDNSICSDKMELDDEDEILPDKKIMEEIYPSQEEDLNVTVSSDIDLSYINDIPMNDEFQTTKFSMIEESDKEQSENEKQSGRFLLISTESGSELEYEVVEDEENEEKSEESKVSETKVNIRSKEPLKCPHCPTDFVFLKNLNKHLERHKKAFITQSQFKLGDVKPQPEEIEIGENKPEIIFESTTINKEGEEVFSAVTIDEIIEESTFKPEAKTQPEEYPFKCENCGAGFRMERSLKFHRKLNRCTVKQFECLVCHKIFISKVTLIEHMKIHTETFQCLKCMKEFNFEEDYKSHMDNEHVTGKGDRNQCKVCRKSFTMLSALKDHMRVHSGEKPYICETCGKGFSQGTNLKQHTMRHNNTKPFKCSQCPNQFVSKGELNSHMRKHTGEHPFICDTCGSGFTTSSSLKKHIRIHTGERPYACDFCPMRFSALGTLKNHRRTHTGEKPYLCRFCGRGFAQQSDRVTHERTHTGERPYVCSVCGSAFQQNGALKIHMKLHSDGRTPYQGSAKKRKQNTEDIEAPSQSIT